MCLVYHHLMQVLSDSGSQLWNGKHRRRPKVWMTTTCNDCTTHPCMHVSSFLRVSLRLPSYSPLRFLLPPTTADTAAHESLAFGVWTKSPWGRKFYTSELVNDGHCYGSSVVSLVLSEYLFRVCLFTPIVFKVMSDDRRIALRSFCIKIWI